MAIIVMVGFVVDANEPTDTTIIAESTATPGVPVTVQVISVVPVTVILVAAMPLMVTCAALVKLVPVMVMVCPMVSVAGIIEVMVGVPCITLPICEQDDIVAKIMIPHTDKKNLFLTRFIFICWA